MFRMPSSSGGRRSPCGRGARRTHTQRPILPRPRSAAQIGRPRPAGASPAVGQDRAVVLVERGGVAALDQIGAVRRGAAERLVPAPAGDLAVVAAEQHLRDAAAAPLGGLGVDGPLQQVGHRAGGEGVVLVRLGVAEHAGQQPGDGLDHHQHRAPRRRPGRSRRWRPRGLAAASPYSSITRRSMPSYRAGAKTSQGPRRAPRRGPG